MNHDLNHDRRRTDSVLDDLAAYLRTVCPDCFEAIAASSQVDRETLIDFAFDDAPMSLTTAGKVFLSIHQIRTRSKDRLA